MKVLYKGDIPVHLMHEGQVWEVHPGDDLELPSVPQLPGFEAVKVKGANAVNDSETN
jgi:hypothetical protein